MTVEAMDRRELVEQARVAHRPMVEQMATVGASHSGGRRFSYFAAPDEATGRTLSAECRSM